jgi:hypothetical protein
VFSTRHEQRSTMLRNVRPNHERTHCRKIIDADALERKARWRDMTKHQRIRSTMLRTVRPRPQRNAPS